MKFEQTLLSGILVKRYKRFLADIKLDNGEVITAHTANTGAMLGCSTPGSRVWLSVSANPRRKYAHSWELVEDDRGVLVGINTGLANNLVSEAISDENIKELTGYNFLQREKPVAEGRSRIDIYLEGNGKDPCYVEVKNVTASEDGRVAIFPDAVSARGRKHLVELGELVYQGYRSVMLFCVQRGDVSAVAPAELIDPGYASGLRDAKQAGVELLAYQAEVTPRQIRLRKALPVIC